MDVIQALIAVAYGFIFLTVIVFRAVKGRNGDEKIFKEFQEDPAAPRVRIVKKTEEAHPHDHISSMALDTQKQLEQLDRLHRAGLYTDGEYREKKRQIRGGD